MYASPAAQTRRPSVLSRLRALAPPRTITITEAMRVAELQAAWLLSLSRVQQGPVPSEIVTALPRLLVDYDFDMPDQASGASDWDCRRGCWVVTLNPRHSDERQRFTLLHEFKHIVDHGHPGLRLSAINRGRRYNLTPVEFVADYFAGCVLVPKTMLKRAWGGGIQTTRQLAALFEVSERAMQVRLQQTGLTATHGRCPEPDQTNKERHRSRSGKGA